MIIRKKIIRFPLISVILIVLFNINIQAQNNFQINGYVYNEINNTPLQNFPVTLYPDITDLSNKYTVYTSTTGNFFLTIPFEDATNLLVEIKSYCHGNWIFKYDTIKLFNGTYEKIYNICYEAFSDTKEKIIYGYVVDKETNRPIPHQKIFIYDEKSSVLCHTVLTNKDGYYSDTITIHTNDTLNIIAATESYCNSDRNIISQCVNFISNSVEINFEICKKVETFSNVSFFYKMYQNSNIVYFSAVTNFEPDSIFWDFGDKQTGVGEEIYHTFVPGSYKVRIWAYKNGVAYQFSDRIVVGKTVTLSGQVFLTDTLCPYGYVVAYKHTKSTTFDIIKTAKINQGSFYFPNLIKGDYVFYAIPRFDINENYFPKYIATYNSGENFWQDANTISIDKNTSCNIKLAKYEEIYYGNNQITISVNKNIFDTLDILNILLINDKNEIINSKYLCAEKQTDIFKNLPSGKYTIVSEVSGYKSNPTTIIINSNSHTNIYFYTFNGEINSYANIKECTQEEQLIKIYPNPFIENISINSSIENNSITLTIYDIAGEIKYKKQIHSKNEIINPEISISGVYIAAVTDESGIVLTRELLIKQ